MTELKPTLLVLYPGCTTFEVMLTLELLRHYTQVIATSPYGADVTDSSGILIHTSTKATTRWSLSASGWC